MPDQELVRKEENPVSPTMRELAMVLFRQRKLFVGVSGLVFVLAVLYAFAGATYRTQVRGLVRRGRADPPVAAQENAPPDFSRAEVTEEELNSEVELLKADDVLRRVVEANDLAVHDWLRWLRPHEEQAARVERAAKAEEAQSELASPAKTVKTLAFSGIHVVSPRLFAKIDEEGAFSIVDAYLRLAAHGEEIIAFRADESYWRDLGRPESLIQAARDFDSGKYA